MSGGTKTYKIPSDGEYNFVVQLSFTNKETHNSLSNKVSLKIGSQTITVFNHYYEGPSWKETGATSKTLTKQCTAGDKIILTTANNNSEYNVYTNAALMIY